MMKLYYSPMACSLADHIALLEAGVPFEQENVDLRTKRTESGNDLKTVSEKGYVPILVLDDGTVITENIAILDWIATTYPSLGVSGPLGRTRTLEALAFISTELHRQFKPMWHGGSQSQKSQASRTITELFDAIARTCEGDFLFGDKPSVADFYLFVMLLWAERFDVVVSPQLIRLRKRMLERPAVEEAMRSEGLL